MWMRHVICVAVRFSVLQCVLQYVIRSYQKCHSISHVNASRHSRIRRVTHEYVVSRRNESVVSYMNWSCNIWVRHVTYGCCMFHGYVVWMCRFMHCNTQQRTATHCIAYVVWICRFMHMSFDMWLHHVTYEGVMSHMNASCHTWVRRVTYDHVRLLHVPCENVVSHVIASCHIWMRHIWIRHVTYEVACSMSICCFTYDCIMSHMNASCHIWMRHDTHECVVSRMSATCHIRLLHVPCGYVFSHVIASRRVWMRHVIYECVIPHMNASCHIWMRCVAWNRVSRVVHGWVMPRMNASCHITIVACFLWMCRFMCDWVMSHLKGSCHTLMSRSRVRRKWVMRHMKKSCHVAGVMSHVDESWHIWMRHVTCEYVMSHMRIRHVTDVSDDTNVKRHTCVYIYKYVYMYIYICTYI